MLDHLYVRARAALLDAVEALGSQSDAVVLVGAQAIYLHTGDANLAVAEYTTDADFTISPDDLSDVPLLGELLGAAGFLAGEHPGGWLSPDGIKIDLMVPELLAGPGRRGADLGVHGRRAARRAKGLEGALIDRERHAIGALDDADDRSVPIWVAGAGALLVAKVHKIAERFDRNDRVRDKDALDVFRLLRATPTEDLAARLRLLRNDERAGDVTTEALENLSRLFGDPLGDGAAMAVRAIGGAEDEGV
ncbi:MAG: hypothetical protein WD602_02400, partial [Actinomycetota bacterium]